MLTVKKLFCLSLILASLSLSACNTVHGAGEDIESAGHHVENAAD